MILVCGEALMDVFAAGDTATGLALDARVGGSPFNVAVGLARLGQPVALHAAISRDFLGERLLRALLAEGVDTRTVQRTAAATTLGLVGVDARGVPAYSFYGEGGADRQLEALLRSDLPAEVRAIHLGSYTTVVQPVAAALCALVEREHGRVLIACDPNVRLNVEPAIERWRETLAWMLSRAHLLKISSEDLQLLFPDESAEAFAARALTHGARLVVVTKGERGAEAWTANAHAAAAPTPVAVVDTVGAGDSFQAAWLAWLAERDALSARAIAGLSAADLAAALAFAGTAAAITCSRRGADLPRRDEIA